MAETIYYLMETYNEMVANHTDPRTMDWPLMSSPFLTLHFVVAYILLILLLRSQMKNKKPLELGLVTIIYNVIQFVVCAWLFCTATGVIYKFSLNCEPAYKVPDPEILTILSISWYFYIFRFLDFARTIILILRKQNDKVTWLHVLYTASIPMLLWTGLKFVPDSHYTVGTYINIFVYMLMYLQNILEALGSNYLKYMNWKYNPAIILVYILLIIVQSYNTLQSDCYGSVPFGTLVTIQHILLFVISYIDGFTIMDMKVFIQIVRNFSKLGEMCIPNQERLLEPNPDEEKIEHKNE